MLACNQLIHPFQRDAGTSQAERSLPGLVQDAPAIDARTLADLLQFFQRLAPHINFYDMQLQVSSWQPFFQHSLPFQLAAMINLDTELLSNTYEHYNFLLKKSPTTAGLQLCLLYIYQRGIKPIYQFQEQIQNSGLELAVAIEKQIQNLLQQPVRDFIGLANAMHEDLCVAQIDFSILLQQPGWGLKQADLFSKDETYNTGGKTQYEQLLYLGSRLYALFNTFVQTLANIAGDSAPYLQQSFVLPDKEENQKHAPHLALIFVFLEMFMKLQQDLNGFTQKHLDYFYQNVLHIKPESARPDHVHVLFELQNQIRRYALRTGTPLKDGKDARKSDILFAMDEDLVVTRATTASLRTLFANYQRVQDTTYVEGVYMAPDASKADGLSKDFPEGVLPAFPTMGGHYSPFMIEGTQVHQPYPAARLGFVLASPVLYLAEGTRTITIELTGHIEDQSCAIATPESAPDPTVSCCDTAGGTNAVGEPNISLTSSLLFTAVQKALKKRYIVVTEEGLQAARQAGIAAALVDQLRRRFLTDVCKPNLCCTEGRFYRRSRAVREKAWNKALADPLFSASDRKVLAGLFVPQYALDVSFSGEKDWLRPMGAPTDPVLALELQGAAAAFTLKITMQLGADQGPLSFYDESKLKEKTGTTLPLARVLLNDAVKLPLNKKLRKALGLEKKEHECCLEYDTPNCGQELSFYHFFRDMVLDDTNIKVQVCGLKKFIVQNDESLQDVGGTIYPYGTRPNVPDFDMVNPVVNPKNLVGPSFYIGASEIFCKKWKEVFVNLNWKDRPSDFAAYYKAYLRRGPHLFGLDADQFQVNLAVLEEGNWKPEINHVNTQYPPFPARPLAINLITGGNNRLLFEDDGQALFCAAALPAFDQTYYLNASYFPILPAFRLTAEKVARLDPATRNGFLKINLQNQDFGHKNYAFVLARQMMAFGKLPQTQVEGAVYYDPAVPGSPVVFDSTLIQQDITDANTLAGRINVDVNDPVAGVDVQAGPGAAAIPAANANAIRNTLRGGPPNLVTDAQDIEQKVSDINTQVNNVIQYEAVIPGEPWTPVLRHIELDYVAVAERADVTLIHLLPFENTYQEIQIDLQPYLFPHVCNEGQLYIGIDAQVPGQGLSLLFQLAEATGDAEVERPEVQWSYLQGNQWRPLRRGFEVLEDATENLTVSGIVKLALPDAGGDTVTVMPTGLYWISAAVARNSGAISNTIGIHTQAVRATFINTEENDALRLSAPLAAGSVSKLQVADANIKAVSQPYESFGGAVPEVMSSYYVRVSEVLRHKGRAIQRFDYERLVLEAFPQVYRAKCINHSFALDAHRYFNDFPMAPGYVIVAVLPDVTRLKAANSYEPVVPISILEQIEDLLTARSSPFVRIRASNPRYERIHFCITVKLLPGKDPSYYQEQLAADLKKFLAPWADGLQEALRFGACVNRSSVIGFLETTDYVDYVLSLRMYPDGMDHPPAGEVYELCPATPRSILIAGDVDVCIDEEVCEEWDEARCAHEPLSLEKPCFPLKELPK